MSRVILSCVLLGSYCFVGTTAAIDTVFQADFSQSTNVSHTTSNPNPSKPLNGPNWTFTWQGSPQTDSTTNFFRTTGGRIETEDWGATSEFFSDTFDVSNYDLVDIASSGSARGSSIFNNQSTSGGGPEFLKYFYALDGGNKVYGSNITSDGGISYSFSDVDVSSAASMVIGFEFFINGAGDGFNLTQFRVQGEPASAPAFPGDFDRDNDVDGDDLLVWGVAYGVSNAADADNDSDSDGADFMLWQKNHGSVLIPTGVHAIPEPSALILAALSLLVTSSSRRTRG